MINNNLKKIEVGVGLADAELLFYFRHKEINNLTVKIQTWNSKIIEFTFYDVILFIDRGGNGITAFCENICINIFFF